MVKLTTDQQKVLNKIIAEEVIKGDTEDIEVFLKRVCKRFDEEVLGEDKINLYDLQPIKELIQQKLAEYKAAMV